VIFPVIIALAAVASCQPSDMVDYGEAAWRGDDAIRIEDTYKWLFHATRGGEHAIRNEDAARKWLEREWVTLGSPEPGEPLIVPLRPDGALVRLNLRPFRARGGRLGDLFDCFVRSARFFHGSPDQFEAAWTELGRRLEASPRECLDAESWRRLDSEARAKGFPAWGHSATFETAHHPAYRVLIGEEARKLIGSLAN
jgi:hypothetical protein